MAIEELFDVIGGFHKFQVIMVVCVYSMKIMLAWSMMQMAFAGVIPDYKCVVSEEEGGEMETNVCSVNGTVCQRFTYLGHANTVISEWDLVCDLKGVKPLLTSLQMGGVLLGAIVSGQSGDYFGRKKTTYGFCLFHLLTNVGAALSVNWQMFAVFRFLIGFGIGSMLVMVIPYPSEFLPVKWRAIIPCIPMWPLGQSMFALGAWLLEDWRKLHWVCAALIAPNLLGIYYIPESPRWLTVQGRVAQAHDVLKKMAQVNGKSLPANAEAMLHKISKNEAKSRENGQKYSYTDLFNARTARFSVIFAFK